MQGSLDYSKATPLPAASWKASRSASAVFATNTTETYVFIVINTGSTSGSTQVGFRFAAYDKSSTGASMKAHSRLSFLSRCVHCTFHVSRKLLALRSMWRKLTAGISPRKPNVAELAEQMEVLDISAVTCKSASLPCAYVQILLVLF